MVFVFISYLLAFAIIVYNIIVLIKRKEYENKRIFFGYNILMFGLVILALSLLTKTVKFAFLTFTSEQDYLVYMDIIGSLILTPLFAISFLVAMWVFKDTLEYR